MTETFTFFYSNKSPFSQWHKADFKIDGIQYNCAEQYMMHQKALMFNDAEMAAQILKTPNPGKQKALGRKVKDFDPGVWYSHSKDIVYTGNVAKFSQNEHLKKHLLKTAGTTLVEASPYDTIWGIGMAASNPKVHNKENWNGTNWLGEILTRVREEFLIE